MTRLHVGIIGGGAAGVIAAKWLRAAGHSVVVFEKSGQIGGVWKYQQEINTDASMYKSLHTNLPTSVMQLDDYPFPPGIPSFPSHTHVLEYIQGYAHHFNLTNHVRFHSNVELVVQTLPHTDCQRSWTLHIDSTERGKYQEFVDRVVVCNGHFSVPFYPTIPGLQSHFKGHVLHSHNYRTPTEFLNKNVLVVGRGPSGQDISLELAKSGHAAQVIVVCKDSQLKDDERLFKPPILEFTQDQCVVFTDGTSIKSPDVVLLATGYLYNVQSFLPPHLLYPSLTIPTDVLDTTLRADLEAATRAGHAIAPLYKQVFSIENPDIAFIGLPFKNLPFLSFELQAKWIARVFQGTTDMLPSKQKMYESFRNEIKTLPFPLRKLHELGKERQAQYFAELEKLSSSFVNPIVQQMFEDAGYLRHTYPLEYRNATYTKEGEERWIRRLQITRTQELIKIFE